MKSIKTRYPADKPIPDCKWCHLPLFECLCSTQKPINVSCKLCGAALELCRCKNEPPKKKRVRFKRIKKR